MNPKNKKRLMTDVAKGKFTMDEAEAIIESKEEPQEKAEPEIKPKKTQKRKLNPKGGKK